MIPWKYGLWPVCAAHPPLFLLANAQKKSVEREREREKKETETERERKRKTENERGDGG